MRPIVLITFEGCPNADRVRTALTRASIDFKEVDQEKLQTDHLFKNYTSPSVLHGDRLLYGSCTDGQSSGCTFSEFDEAAFLELIEELNTR